MAGSAKIAFAPATPAPPPVWQLVHWPDGQPAAPVKELALLIGQVFPHARRVIEHAAVQGNVLAARQDLQRVELQVLHGAHGRLGALAASPASSGPQALLAQDEATGGLDGDGEHDNLSSEMVGYEPDYITLSRPDRHKGLSMILP